MHLYAFLIERIDFFLLIQKCIICFKLVTINELLLIFRVRAVFVAISEL